MPIFSRAAVFFVLALAPAIAIAPAMALAEPPLRLVVMEPEIDGDTSDTERRAEWQERLTLLGDHITSELTARALYEVVDPADAHVVFAKHRRRTDVYACDACAAEVAEVTDADRVLSLWVFRMSSLVLTLHGIIRNGEDGKVLYANAIDFRGDNDRSWLRAADHLIRGMPGG